MNTYQSSEIKNIIENSFNQIQNNEEKFRKYTTNNTLILLN